MRGVERVGESNGEVDQGQGSIGCPASPRPASVFQKLHRDERRALVFAHIVTVQMLGGSDAQFALRGRALRGDAIDGPLIRQNVSATCDPG